MYEVTNHVQHTTSNKTLGKGIFLTATSGWNNVCVNIEMYNKMRNIHIQHS